MGINRGYPADRRTKSQPLGKMSDGERAMWDRRFKGRDRLTELNAKIGFLEEELAGLQDERAALELARDGTR